MIKLVSYFIELKKKFQVINLNWVFTLKHLFLILHSIPQQQDFWIINEDKVVECAYAHGKIIPSLLSAIFIPSFDLLHLSHLYRLTLSHSLTRSAHEFRIKNLWYSYKCSLPLSLLHVCCSFSIHHIKYYGMRQHLYTYWNHGNCFVRFVMRYGVRCV